MVVCTNFFFPNQNRSLHRVVHPSIRLAGRIMADRGRRGVVRQLLSPILRSALVQPIEPATKIYSIATEPVKIRDGRVTRTQVCTCCFVMSD